MPIHPTAIIGPQAEVDPSVDIGPYVVIDGTVRIGRGTRILAHAVLTGWTDIGEDNEIHMGAVIGHTPQDFTYKGEQSFLKIGHRNITANCVAPGATNTRILAGVPQKALDAIRQQIPKGRFAEVEDIVPTYVFLASDEARHMVGQCISPNGGDIFL